MTPSPSRAVYLKHYPNGKLADTRIFLFEDGTFEEELATSADELIAVGEWGITHEDETVTVSVRIGDIVRRYDTGEIWGDPPTYASGIEPDTGLEARLYRTDPTDADSEESE
ncbi:hypothetical protein [Microbacterium phyllosphaerae]